MPTIHKINVFFKTPQFDFLAKKFLHEWSLFDKNFDDAIVKSCRSFVICSEYSKKQIEKLAQYLFIDPIVEDCFNRCLSTKSRLRL